jgi:opacity protein-like surface antigen
VHRRNGYVPEHRILLSAGLVVAIMFAAALVPNQAHAQSTEATFSIGALLGDDIGLNLGIIDDATAKFENSPIYGGRLGWYGFPLGIEGSVMYSPTGVVIEPSFLTPDKASLLYAEANVLLIIIPGPVAPFVTGGVGAHRIEFGFGQGKLTETVFGWNWGGGLKAKFGPISLRGDLRDHVSKFESDDVLALLGIANTFHNWEASVGIGVAF